MDLSGFVDTLNILGDESRIRLCALLREREVSVTDLVRVTGISQSRVSTHLARLREGGFVRDRRDGQRTFYGLAKDSLPNTAKAFLEEAARSEDPTLGGDKRRLSALDAERRGALPESFAGEMERHYSPGRTWESLAVGLSGFLRLGDVLDVGSGDGAAAGYLAPYCRSLTCIDTNGRMIAAAHERLGRYENVRAEEADVADARCPFRRRLLRRGVHPLSHAPTTPRSRRGLSKNAPGVLRPNGRASWFSRSVRSIAQREITTPPTASGTPALPLRAGALKGSTHALRPRGLRPRRWLAARRRSRTFESYSPSRRRPSGSRRRPSPRPPRQADHDRSRNTSTRRAAREAHRHHRRRDGDDDSLLLHEGSGHPQGSASLIRRRIS